MQMGRISFALALIIMALPALAKTNDINTYSNHDPAAAAANDLRRLPPDTIIPGIRRQSAAERDQILCLALAMYHEARGQTEAERTAVAQVIYNRALHTNVSVCATVWADNGSQFQWVKASATIVPRESGLGGRTRIVRYDLHVTGRRTPHMAQQISSIPRLPHLIGRKLAA